MKFIYFLVLVFLFCLHCAFAANEDIQSPSKNSAFASAVKLYKDGDFDKAKSAFFALDKFANPQEKAYANLLLANIAAATGDLNLAMECFPLAFSDIPENNEYPLAYTFARFCDTNAMFSFSAKYLEPLFEKNPDLPYKNSMLAFWYARALFENGKAQVSKKVLEKIWDKFSESETEEGIDKILFDENLSQLLRDYVSKSEAKNPLSALRKKIILGGKDLGELPESLPLGLVFWLSQNTKEIPEMLMESAVEANKDSAFAWQILFELAKKYFDKGEYAMAFGFASRADTLAPAAIEDTWSLKILMGDCLRFLKRPQEAIKCYGQVSKNPACQGSAAAEALFKLGLCYYEQQRWANASYYFQYVVVAYAGEEYWIARAYYYGALSQVELGNNVIAKNFLREYMRKAKDKNTEIYQQIRALWTQIPF